MKRSKVARLVNYARGFVPRLHGRSFLCHVREARRIGLLGHRYRECDLRRACPGWAWRTYFNFPDSHPDLFIAFPDRTFSLIEDQPITR